MIILSALGALLLAVAPPLPQPNEETVWRNPSGSVHVRVHPCGQGLCGTVIWANDKAKADSARGGTPNLVGTQLFRNFRASAANVWSGKVFVPDLNRVFSGTATLLNGNTLIARGCLAKNFGCKSQTWTRLR
jgi:uncharacterized protein (DUF2147 family)